MKTYLNSQLQRIDDVIRQFDEPDVQLFDDLRMIVRQTEKQAAQEGFTQVLRICQIREGGITESIARQVITESIAECNSPKQVRRQHVALETVESVFARCSQITTDPVAAATLTIAAIKSEQGIVTLTPEEAGVIMRCTPETVITWIRMGQLKAANLSSSGRPRFLILSDDLLNFLALRQPQPPKSRQKKSKKASEGYNKFSSSR